MTSITIKIDGKYFQGTSNIIELKKAKQKRKRNKRNKKQKTNWSHFALNPQAIRLTLLGSIYGDWKSGGVGTQSCFLRSRRLAKTTHPNQQRHDLFLFVPTPSVRTAVVFFLLFKELAWLATLVLPLPKPQLRCVSQLFHTTTGGREGGGENQAGIAFSFLIYTLEWTDSSWNDGSSAWIWGGGEVLSLSLYLFLSPRLLVSRRLGSVLFVSSWLSLGSPPALCRVTLSKTRLALKRPVNSKFFFLSFFSPVGASSDCVSIHSAASSQRAGAVGFKLFLRGAALEAHPPKTHHQK